MEQDVRSDGRVYVWKERFAIVKAKKPHPEAFANIMDGKEITVIIDEAKIDEVDTLEMEPGWKLLTFDMVLPFNLVGFLAKVASALAKKSVSIFVISSYSTDHILVKENDLKNAKEALEELGFVVQL